MAEIKLSDGTVVKELRRFDGVKWITSLGKIYHNGSWEVLSKAEHFREDFVEMKGMSRLSNTGKILNGKLLFNTVDRYSVY